MTDIFEIIAEELIEGASEAFEHQDRELLLTKMHTMPTLKAALLEKQERDKGCGCPCGESDASFCETCNKIRVQAIKEKLERDNQNPLTLAQLKEKVGEPVWYQSTTGGFKEWVIIEKWFPYQRQFSTNKGYLSEDDYGKTWLAYTNKQKEEL